jgi:quercetin dioxygenase-like cupin family protein
MIAYHHCMTAFSNFNDTRPYRVWDGVKARAVDGERITMALVDLAPNSVVAEHKHENEQLGFVIGGSLTFTIGGETRELIRGDTYVIGANVPHQASAGPDGCVVVDVFSPIRADWEKLPRDEPSSSRWLE